MLTFQSLVRCGLVMLLRAILRRMAVVGLLRIRSQDGRSRAEVEEEDNV